MSFSLFFAKKKIHSFIESQSIIVIFSPYLSSSCFEIQDEMTKKTWSCTLFTSHSINKCTFTHTGLTSGFVVLICYFSFGLEIFIYEYTYTYSWIDRYIDKVQRMITR